MKGWVDVLTSESMLIIEMLGIGLGVFHGVAKDALCIDIDLRLAKGDVVLDVKAFDEIWLHIDTVQREKGDHLCGLNYKTSVHLLDLINIGCQPWTS